jgi:transcriptional regulator
VRYLRGLLARLTRHHEAAEPRPWKMGDAPADYLDDMLQRIVGIEVAVTTLVGKAKLSQNKTAEDRQGAAEALDVRGRAALAQAMRSAG